MAGLEGHPTHKNLRRSFSDESATVHRYLYFAKIADIEGYPELAQLYYELAEGGLHSVHGCLDFLKQVGDPLTDRPIGISERNLAAAILAESRQAGEQYPAMADQAREDGFPDVASWLETLAKLKQAHLARLERAARKMDNLDAGEDPR